LVCRCVPFLFFSPSSRWFVIFVGDVWSWFG
jgi:hypothetical protein